MEKYSIFIDSNDGRFANQLYPLFVALSIYDHNKDIFDKIYFKNYFNDDYNDYRINPIILNRLNSKLFEVCEFDNEKFDKHYEIAKNNLLNNSDFNIIDYNNINKHIEINGFMQIHSLINEDTIIKYLSPTKEIKDKIFDLYGDLSDYIILHVRRTDYLKYGNQTIYYTLSKQYILNVINKYYKNDKIFVISDDIKWCIKHLNNISNISFADKSDDVLIDFYIQTIGKGNICSCSSFSVAGAILNKNKNCVIPEPFFKNKSYNIKDNLQIVPRWSKREQVTEDMQ